MILKRWKRMVSQPTTSLEGTMKSTTDARIELLRAVPALAALPERALSKLAELVDEITVATGRVLAREGTSGREAFVVIEGTGTVFVEDQAIAAVGPGGFIGEMAMLDGQPRCATVRADSDMRLLVIGPVAFASFVEHPGVLHAMATQLADRLRRADAGLPREPVR
jgi:trk system potassium uptake protein TrkA